VVHRPVAGEHHPAPRADPALALHGDLTIAPAAGALRFGELGIEGWSRAGEETWFRIQPPGLGLDVGRGAESLIGARDLFLSHGHLDHVVGLPWILSQRRFQALGPTRIVCPGEIADELESFVAAAERLERVEYEREIVGLAPGQRIEVGRDLSVEAFPVDHVVPSLGYHLIRTRRRLLDRLQGLEGAEIARRRKAGERIEEEREEIWLSYCGDTGPGVFELAPALGRSRVLLIECTFLGDELRDRGRRFGHLHVEDLERHGELFEGCEAIVLHHLSRRHRREELAREVARRLPGLASRVHLLVAEAA